jgi:hypothetical protein
VLVVRYDVCMVQGHKESTDSHLWGTEGNVTRFSRTFGWMVTMVCRINDHPVRCDIGGEIEGWKIQLRRGEVCVTPSRRWWVPSEPA